LDRDALRDESALDAIIAEIDDGGIRVYQNVLQKPYIVFQINDRPQGTFYLYDESVYAWLAHFIWEEGLGLIHQRELDRILTVLAGRAMRSDLKKLDDPGLLRLVESEPVIAVALEVMHACDSGRIEQQMAAIWKDWRKFAKDRGLLKLGRKRFPGGANVLSRQLRQLSSVLNALGISVKLKRSDGGYVTLTRTSDDSQAESSAESSSPKSMHDEDLERMDNRAALVARFQARKSRPTP